LKKLRVVGPGGFALGGRTLPAGSKVGTLQITFGTDNIWQSGHEIGVDTDILATGRAHEWEMIPIYSGAISDADNSPVSGVKEGVTSLTHSFTIGASGTAGVPGKLFIEMDRTGLTKAHNEATETWIITIFDKARDSAGDVIIPEERLVTNPSVSKVYRWLTEEHTTIQVGDIFSAVAGRLAVVIKDPAASATSTPEPTPSTPSPSPTPPPTPTNTPPVVTVSGPTTGSASAPTPNLEFTATVVDDNDNSTTLESALVWFIDGEPAGTIGPTLLSPGLQLGLKDPAVPAEGPHTIRAFSLDSGSLTGVGTLIITLSP